jgi:hypothetical protein
LFKFLNETSLEKSVTHVCEQVLPMSAVYTTVFGMTS